MPDMPEGEVATDGQKLRLTDWVIRLAVAFVFASSGYEKFSTGASGQQWIQIFSQIGFGDWFRYLTGVLEIAGGVLLLVPSATMIGVGLLVSCMVGAIAAHIFFLHDPFSSVINIGLIIAILFAGRRRAPENDEPVKLSLE